MDAGGLEPRGQRRINSGDSETGGMGLLARSQGARTQLLRNSLFNCCAWATTVGVNFVAIPIVIRCLGVEGFGIYVLLTGLFGYFGLLDFGFSDGVIKYVAHHLELGDHNSVAQSIKAALLVQLIAGTVGVVTIWVFNGPFVHLLHVGPALFRAASVGLYVSSIGFLAKMLLNTCNAALKGLQRFDVLAKLTAGFSVLTTIAVVLALLGGGRLLAAVTINAVMIVANLAVVLVFIFHYVPSCRLSFLVAREHFHTLFGFGAYVFVSRIANALNSYFLQVVVAVILGPAAVSYLAVPMKLTSTLEGGFNSLIGVIFPHVSALKAQGNTESLQRLYSAASKYVVALSTPVFLLFILFSKQILAVWLGAEFSARAWPVLTILSCASLLGVWTMVPANIIYGTGDTKVAALFGSVVAAVNLVFSVLLTMRYGIIGTSAAVLITATQGPIFIWYVTSRVVGVSPTKYFEQVFALHIVPSTVFCLISLRIMSLANGMASQSSLLALVLGGALSALYYSLLVKFRFGSLGD